MTANPHEHLLQDLRWLRRLAGSLVHDAATADDLVGDTLHRWLQQRGPIANLRAWLGTVLRHRAIRVQRRAAMRARREQAVGGPLVTPAVDESLATAQFHRSVVDAVLALPEPMRVAIVLRYLEELPLGEVARRLAVPTETARSRIKRGLERLRQRLDDHYGERSVWAALAWPAAATPLSLLGLLMAAKTMLGLSAIAAAALLFFWLPHDGAPAPTAGGLAASPAAAPLAVSSPTASAATTTSRESATPPPAVAAGPAALAVVSGRVIDEQSLLPIPDTLVSWQQLDGDVEPLAATARTDAGGNFTLSSSRSAPQQHFDLLLRAPGHALMPVSLGESTAEGPPQRFELGDLLLAAGTAVTGRVVDTEGNAVGGARLFVCLQEYWTEQGRVVFLEQALPAGIADADGRFRLDECLLPAAPGVLLLAAQARGVGWLEVEGLRRQPHAVEVVVALQRSQDLEVQVVDEQGAAIPDASVLAEPRFAPIGRAGSLPIHLETVPGLGGAFGVDHVAGRLHLSLPLANDAAPTPYTLRVAAPGRGSVCVPMTLPHADAVVVVLPRPHPLQLQGRVFDAAGRAIANARVGAHWGEAAAVVTTTADDGRYVLPGLARGQGSLQVSVLADGCFPAHRELQPEATASTFAADFELAPAITLRGRVVDQEGAPVPGAMVFREGGDRELVPCAADGTFTLPLPPAKASMLRVFPPEQGAWCDPVQHVVLPDQDAVTLVLTRQSPARGAIDVELLAADGTPLEPKRTMLQQRLDDDLSWHASTGSIGRVHAEDLPLGDWLLEVDPVTGPELVLSLTLQHDGERLHVRLQQPVPVRARGELQLDAAAGAAPEQVELWFPSGSQRARFVADPDQELLADGRRLRLRPARGMVFHIVDVDPDRPLCVQATADRCCGQATANAAGGAEINLTLRLQKRCYLVLVSEQPLPVDGLELQVRRPGEPWGELQRFSGLGGRTDLMNWPLASGAWQWRVRLPTRGASNRGGAAWQQGDVELTAGAAATVRVIW